MKRVTPKVIRYIVHVASQDGCQFSMKQLREHFPDCSPSSLHSVVQRLKRKGYIFAERSSGGVCYRINPQKLEELHEWCLAYEGP